MSSTEVNDGQTNSSAVSSPGGKRGTPSGKINRENSNISTKSQGSRGSQSKNGKNNNKKEEEASCAGNEDPPNYVPVPAKDR